MPAPVITNIFNNENPLTAYVGEPFSAKIPVSNTPTRLSVTGSWIGWSYRWLAATEEVELYITPTRLLKVLASIDEATQLPITDKATYTGIRMQAFNDDGDSNIAIVPFAFIHRAPIIDDIPTQEWKRGQTGIDFTVRIQHKPNAVTVRGDLLGLNHQASGAGVRIFGDIVDGDLTKPSGTYTIDAVNATGAAPQKTGRWGIRQQPYKPTGVSFTAASQQITLMWEILSYPDLTQAEVKIATSPSRLSSAGWTPADSDTQHTFRNLINGTTYYFQVRGLNSSGYSPVSDVFSAAPQSVPTAPTELRVARGEQQLTATWTIGAAFPALQRQQIRWATTTGELALADWKDLAADATSYIITDLDHLTTYYVEVRGVNSEGEGAAARASGQTYPERAVPSATTVSLTARDHELLATWALPTAYPALDKQQIRWATTELELQSASWTDLTATAVRHVIPNLVNGTPYYVQVRGVNAEGDGTLSGVVSGTPQGVPEAPTGFALTVDDKQLTATWTLPQAYPALDKQQIRWATTELELQSASWTDLTATAVRHVIPNLVNGTTYYVQVRGINAEGNGTVSSTQSAIPEGIPEAPTSLSTAPENTQLIVSWAIGHAYPALQKQQIRWHTDSTIPDATKWTDVTAEATTHTISDLANGTTYYVQVRGVNSVGEGVISETVSGEPSQLVKPTAPTNLKLVSRNGANANIAWDASTGVPTPHYEYRVQSVLRSGASSYLRRTEINWRSTGSSDTTATVTVLTARPGAAAGVMGLVNLIEVRAVNLAGTGPASTALEVQTIQGS